MRRVKKVRIAVVGLLATCAITLAGCNNPWEAPSDTSVTQLANEQTIAVVGDDGNVKKLPVVTGVNLVKNDSTKFKDTPPVGSEADLQKCGLMKHWSQLVTCMGNQKWYQDGFKTMAPYTASCGLRSWADVVRFANARVKDDKGVDHEIDARVIHVMNTDMTEDEARVIAREMIGNEANNLRVIGAADAINDQFTNSRGLEKNTISPFIDKKPQVRIALAPVLFGSQGEITGLCGDAGVFIDCLNIWGKPRAIAPAPDKPVVCPPGTAMEGKPATEKGCNPPPPSGTGNPPSSPPKTTSPPVTTPPTTTSPPRTTTPPPVTTTNPPKTCPPGTNPPDCTVDKIPSQIPGQPGAAGDGGDSQYGGVGQDPPRTVDPAPAPPAAGPPPSVYVPPPAPPAPEPAPAPPPVQTTRDPSQPTLAPSTQPLNPGTVPTTGCNNPDFC